MTAAAIRERDGFSTTKIFYPSSGKSASPRPLTDPEEICNRIADLAGHGHWTASAASIAAQELLLTIGSISAQNAAATGRAAVTRDQIIGLLQPSPVRGLGTCPELDTHFADGLITPDGNGGVLICAAPAGNGTPEKSYPGWAGPVAGLPHVKRGDQQKLFLAIVADLTRDGIPDGIRLPDDTQQTFARDRKRGTEITLPAWAWAVIFNTKYLPSGFHPISRRTASNRLAELRDAGELVMTRVSKTRLDLRTGRWKTTPPSYALPRPGLRGVIQRFKARVRAATTRQGPSEAWRLQAERWRWRDLEAGWGI